MSNYENMQKELLSKLYNAKINKTDVKETKTNIIDKLIIENGAGMVEVIKDLNNLDYTHITFANGQGDRFFTRANEDYITLKGREYLKTLITN